MLERKVKDYRTISLSRIQSLGVLQALMRNKYIVKKLQ